MQKTVLTIVLCFCLLGSKAVADSQILRLATTTSTENSGLLAYLLPPFEEMANCRVDVIAVGTGRALKLGETGDVDVVLVHARQKEEAFVAAGFGIDRRDLMYNDFVLLGPQDDPAGIGPLAALDPIMQKLAAGGSEFISRGDESGTHSRELQLWADAGIVAGGSWYLETGRGMGETLVMADQRRAYTLSDRGTYIAFRKKTDLEILYAGDPRLFNPYSVIMVNPQRHPHVKAGLARQFADYLTSAETADRIEGFQLLGEPLFYVNRDK
ncbi:MAG: tungsten ABC transporter substrate-binding protein [Desulfuromonas sp.]|nr:MAG: tungsten ABC transporter substrate-binding protein [Desulfuromonas sp.]